MKRPTIKDVAAKACVSTALVSRVMNAPLRQDGLPDCVVHPETAKRIFKAVTELGYHPNKAAVCLRKQLKKRIGVIIPDISNPFFADIARHIESIARKEGYIVLFGSSDENPKQLDTLSEAFMEDGVDGIIITPGVDSQDQVKRIVTQGVPTVITIRDIPGLDGVSRILTDDITATELAFRHLLANGFKSIDMISTYQRLTNAKRREELFSQKMSELKLKYKIHHYNSNDGLEDMKLILENILRRNVRAIYCASANIPIRVLLAGREMGIRIPEDIALIGYDGGQLYRMLHPSITQIEFSREEIAREAFSELMCLITDREVRYRCKYLKPTLSEGESTSMVHADGSAKKAPDSEELISTLAKASIAINNAMDMICSGEALPH